MCWSGEASAVLATAGITTTVYLAKKGTPRDLWMPLGYFTLMEMLQAFTYIWINACDQPPNQIFTLLGYLHIAFQPFFVNMIGMHFLPKERQLKIAPWVYALCAATAVLIISKLYPMAWAGQCTQGVEKFCGPALCSVSGAWHIAWQAPLNGLLSSPVNWIPGMPGLHMEGLHSAAYAVMAFGIPLLYGSWRFVLFHYMFGPMLANAVSSGPNEAAAVWCLLSIGLLMVIAKSPLTRWLYVKA